MVKRIFCKDSFACRNGGIKRTGTRQRGNNKDGEEEAKEDYPTFDTL